MCLLGQPQNFNPRRDFLQVSPALGLVREPQVDLINFFLGRFLIIISMLGFFVWSGGLVSFNITSVLWKHSLVGLGEKGVFFLCIKLKIEF